MIGCGKTILFGLRTEIHVSYAHALSKNTKYLAIARWLDLLSQTAIFDAAFSWAWHVLP